MANKKDKVHEAVVTPATAIHQEHFLIIDEYLSNGMSGTRAVKACRPDVDYKVCQTIWQSIAKSDHGRQYIYDKRRAMRATTALAGEHIAKSMLAWATSDPTIYIGLKPDELKALPYELKQAIQNIKYRKETIKDRQGNTVIKEVCDVILIDKLKALDKIAKHIDWYSADNKSKSNGQERVLQALEGADEGTLNALKTIALLKDNTK